MHFNNIYIFNNLLTLTNSLNNYNMKSDLNLYLNDKYIIGECIENDYILIRIWKSKAFFNYHFNDMDITDNLIGCLDYKIENDNIKIDYLSISDNFDNILPKKKIILKDEDANELKNSLIKYLENIAKKNNLNKIIIDVHNNLRYYNKYYKDIGFILTDVKCNDNPYWIETEKNII